MVERSSLPEIVKRGRAAVAFLTEIAERLEDRPEWLELVQDCRRLAAILSTALEAIAEHLEHLKRENAEAIAEHLKRERQ